MPDFLNKAERSIRMSSIRGRKNKTTELALVAIFRKHKVIGWRRHYSILGRPDFVFPSARLVVFVDGCFWHGCPLHYRLPETNRDFWQKKIETNQRRDYRNARLLRQKGWRVIRIWEHDLKRSESILKRIVTALLKGPVFNTQ